LVRVEARTDGPGDPAAALSARLPGVPVEVEPVEPGMLLDVEMLSRSPHVYKPVVLSDWRRPGRRILTVGEGMIEWPRPTWAEGRRWLRRTRRTNDDLVRETADAAAAEAQLDILHRRGLRAVALLTGEYHHGPYRRTMIARTAAALRAALARGFTHVLVNIGALDAPEYETLLAGVPRRPDGRVVPRVTMCTFQETYSPAAYARFMGTDPENPRSDFARRLTNFDRACDAGM